MILEFDNRFTRELPADAREDNQRRQVLGACYSRVRPTAVSALRGMGGGRELRTTVRRALLAVAAMVAPVALAFAVLAGPLLGLWLGPDATPEMVLALRLLAPGVFFNAIAFVPFSVVQGVGRADLTGRIHLLELPIHGAVAWWLIGRFGVAGAAGAWSLRATLDALLMFLASRRVTRRVA